MKKRLALLAIFPLILTIACLIIPDSSSATEKIPSPIVYYYITSSDENIPQQGSVVILPDELILSPAVSDQTPSSDTVANIRTALESMISDLHNGPVVGNLIIPNVSFSDGHADIILQGDVFAAGDIVLIAVRTMILMTVFSNASIETTIVTLNGQNIANLGISYSGEAKPENYMYSRAEIETFKAENAYPTP
jgi:hypothetical protein